ncbi:MAG: hypothetical protein ACTTIS_00730 [Streptobacillus sp.]|jgi:hypothetical protein|nr:MAG TPA: hypothetical protein [Caudoviricetes sp.]
MPKIKTTEDITTNEDQTTDVVIKEEIKEVIKPTKEEITKIKLVNRNDYDVFIKYRDQEFCISPRGDVICNVDELQEDLPNGVFKLTIKG